MKRGVMMLIAILIILLVATTFGWLKYKLSSTILSAWIVEKNYKYPEKSDIKRITEWVIKKTFKIK